MPATFPNSVRVYTTKTDLVDTVLAEHVNLLQDEVTAVQSALGTGLLTSSWSGVYTNPSNHATVSARLVNIEAGLSSLDTLKAPKSSPTFTGTPLAPTAATSTNSTQVATTAYVVSRIANDAPTKTGTGASGNWAINVTGSAAKLTTARTITLSGDTTGSASFDGSANVTITTTHQSPPFTAAFMMAGL